MRYAFFFWIMVFCLVRTGDAQEKVSLTATRLYYAENTHHVMASNNVVLTYQNTTIHADHLELDTQENTVWAKGKVHISRGEESFEDRKSTRLNSSH